MPSLTISQNRRYLQRPDGAPFFYLGDTAWELFHRLNREEADSYLTNRAQKGFTVIQAVVLAEFNGLAAPNAYGHIPLIDNDPMKPNEEYFAHVDYIVNRATELGMFIGMLPTWGDKVADNIWGDGPEVFTPENARSFGEFLGKRYRNNAIIWILGGDRPADTEFKLEGWRAMVAGIKAGDGGNHLMTYHPWGSRSSSEYVHNEPWLDFNMMQSGHVAKDLPNHEMIAKDYALTPIKPTIDGEPRYEDHPVSFDQKNGWFDAYDVRQATYWGLLAGGCGITYGCHDIWQFLTPLRHPVSHARTPWQTAIDLPGSFQMQHARNLYESRPFTKLVPDQSPIVFGDGNGADHILSARAEDGSFMFLYMAAGNPVAVDMTKISGDMAVAHWYNPRTGEATLIGNLPTIGAQFFTPPTPHYRGCGDWVLVLDDAAQHFPTPGAKA